MSFVHLNDAIASVEKANADLDAVTGSSAPEVLALYARLKNLVTYAETVLAAKTRDVGEIARVTGTSVPKARATAEAAVALRDAPAAHDAFAGGSLSFDQASEIARAERARPEVARELLDTARSESFQVLRERARKVVLEAEQSCGLGERQRRARSGRVRTDELGMIELHLRMQPHVGTPLVRRAEAEANRLCREAKRKGCLEPFEPHLCDAFTKMLSGSSVTGSEKLAPRRGVPCHRGGGRTTARVARRAKHDAEGRRAKRGPPP